MFHTKTRAYTNANQGEFAYVTTRQHENKKVKKTVYGVKFNLTYR